MLKDSSAGYGLFSILLHWTSALLIIFLFAIGIYMVDLGYYDPWYHRAPALHISIGLVLLLLTSIRIFWRIFNSKPQSLPTYSRLTLLLSGAMKYVLYFCILGLLASGYLITTADGKPASLFGLFNFPVLIQLGPTGVDRAGLIHELLAWAIVLLAGLHAVAALLHHFKIRDRTLIRMLKPVRKLSTEKHS
jgi:cytochrome b561